MAIDTKTKRASVFGVGRPWMRTKEPDATQPQPWRIATGWAYGGNAVVEPNLAEFICIRTVTGSAPHAIATISAPHAVATLRCK
jgi:hypothetical protein